jgi:hypothetical protein
MDNSYGWDLQSIADRYYTDDGTRKPFIYFEEYERLFNAVRNEKLHILELGVKSGASILMWRDYFPNSIIVGLDIEDKPACIPDDDQRLTFIMGSQDDPSTLEKAARASGEQFDFIIDDASHIGYLTKRSFCYLFPRWLKPGGYYFIEDFGTGFLPEFPDGSPYVEPSLHDDGSGTRIFESHQFGMVVVIKQLIDFMMKGLMKNSPSYLNIERITILTNLAIIRKSDSKESVSPYPDDPKQSVDLSKPHKMDYFKNRIKTYIKRIIHKIGIR